MKSKDNKAVVPSCDHSRAGYRVRVVKIDVICHSKTVSVNAVCNIWQEIVKLWLSSAHTMWWGWQASWTDRTSGAAAGGKETGLSGRI